MMKIYPKEINIADGNESSCFKIRNSTKDDRVLLFKVRRSQPKLVDFHPKAGSVEPGTTVNVIVKLAQPNITYSTILVKLVVVRMLNLKYLCSWDLIYSLFGRFRFKDHS